MSPVETQQFTVPWYVRKLENKKILAEDLGQHQSFLGIKLLQKFLISILIFLVKSFAFKLCTDGSCGVGGSIATM